MDKRNIAVTLIHISSIISGLIAIPNSALSTECSFDSYIVINGKCIDLTKKSNSNTNTVHRTIYNNSYKDKPEYSSSSPTKTCKDFKYQTSAQYYFDSNPEYKSRFDSDNDGYVCENLKRTGDVLTMKIWQTLLYKNRQRKIETKNKHALTFSQVNNIIGFYPSSNRKRNKYIWEDKISNKKIEIRFFKDEIKDMRSTGF